MRSTTNYLTSIYQNKKNKKYLFNSNTKYPYYNKSKKKYWNRIKQRISQEIKQLHCKRWEIPLTNLQMSPVLAPTRPNADPLIWNKEGEFICICNLLLEGSYKSIKPSPVSTFLFTYKLLKIQNMDTLTLWQHIWKRVSASFSTFNQDFILLISQPPFPGKMPIEKQ